ncbi:MAG: EFR1 family ferrodoxin [Clostridiales bacterium]
MNIEIYYFSGTGNSLYIAKIISEKLQGKLIPIPSLMNKSVIESEADVMGIVFPVYFAANATGIPFLVKRFVKKLEGLDSKYIFSVCSSNNMPCKTIGNLSKMIEFNKGKLSSGFNINMCNKKLSDDMKQKFYNLLKIKKMDAENKNYYSIEKTKDKIDYIVEIVKNKKEIKLETQSMFGKIMFLPFLFLFKLVFLIRYRKLSKKSTFNFSKLVQFSDKSFKSNKECNSCGICEKICPVDNIKIIHGEPKWLHKCESCYACYQWCPKEAIYGDIVRYNEKYHHPNIDVSELIY